jgi:hypothetical protein
MTLITLIPVIAYCVGYVVFRYQHLIVHYASTAGDCYSQHSVEAGSARLAGATINGYIALLYGPLRYIERDLWNWYHPAGFPVPPNPGPCWHSNQP